MNLRIVQHCRAYFFTILLSMLLHHVAIGQQLDSIAYTSLNDCISSQTRFCDFLDLTQNIDVFENLSSGNFLTIHPYSTLEEATLEYEVAVDTTSKTMLHYSISGHPRGNFRARISVTDEQGKQDFMMDSVIGPGWIKDSINISHYRCQTVTIRFHAASNRGQWWFEYAGIDYFYVDTSIDSVLSCPDTLVNKDLELDVFPNPTRNFVTLKLNNRFPAVCKLFDLQGKLVYREEFMSSLRIQNLNLAQGTYIIRVENCDQTIHKRFIQL